MKSVRITDNITVGRNQPLLLIAGPCVIESEKLVLYVATEIKRICERLGISYVFKASFDKANRSSIDSFRGNGIDVGLEIFEKVKNEVGVPILTDIHLPEHADKVKEIVDVIQIPAFLCRQTDLLLAAGQTSLPINVKKGQFLAPWDMENIVHKIESTGNEKIMLCERGTSFGYNNLVVDMTGLVEMRRLGYPIVFDGTHSVQKPGGRGKTSGGNREYVEYLCRAAVATGIDALFLEVHPNPEEALSDGPNMIPLDKLEGLLTSIVEIDTIVKKL
jgi:2-dehydro-3-deoxyphosphooctonate aldolase (KDO 8-P synthase)